MKKLPLSSGDLLADRRADYAEMLAEAGDHAAAAGLMRDALELAPAWAAGWFRLGELMQAAGRPAEAVDAWREALRLDPADRLGAALKLELAGAIPAAGAATSAFAETLFDQYADTFDTALVEKLAYRAPEFLMQAIQRAGVAGFAHGVDLGCGTGLMGERLRGIVSFLEGSDISTKMLARARAKGIYDRLERRDLQMLSPPDEKVDLVTAADVFIYLGRLERIADTVAAMLAPGGLFVFSVERHSGPEPVVLRESRRYAHSEVYLRELLAASGFDLLSLDRVVLRHDRDQPVEGLVALASRRGVPETAAVIPDASEEMQTPALH